jgi:predicted chitinase
MSGKTGFGISISATDSGASAVIDKLNKGIQSLTASGERTSKSLSKFGEVSGINRLNEGMQSVGRSATDVFRAFDQASGSLSSLISPITIAGVVALARSWGNFGTGMKRAASDLELPVSTLSRLQNAAELAGVSADTMKQSLAAMQTALYGAAWNTDPNAVHILREVLHIDPGTPGQVKDAAKGLEELGQALAKLGPHAQQVALDALHIPRAMREVLLNLIELERQSDETGANMTEAQAQHLDAMGASYRKLAKDVEGVSLRITDAWAPMVTTAITSVSKWVEANKGASDSIAEIGTAILSLGALKPAAWVMRLLGLGGLVPGAAVVGGAAALGAGATAAYLTGKKTAEAGDLGFRPSGVPGSVDEAGNVMSWVNPDTKETLTANEMAARLKAAQSVIDQAEKEKAATAAARSGAGPLNPTLGPRSDAGTPGGNQFAGPGAPTGGGPGKPYASWDPSQWYHPPGGAGAVGGSGGGTQQDHLRRAMDEQGVTDPSMRAGIAAIASGEGGFKPRSEAGYGGTSNERIRSIFGSRVAGMSDDKLSALKANPEAFFNQVYGGEFGRKNLGNTEEGEGFKYRGRGDFQLTGKSNYARYSKLTGVDLVANPELANDPEVSSKIAVAYMKDRYHGGGFEGMKRAVGTAVASTETTKDAAYQRYMASGEFAPPPSAVASGSPGAGGGRQTTAELQGHVQVDVHLRGAPPGTAANVTTSGQVRAAPPRIETPLPNAA